MHATVLRVLGLIKSTKFRPDPYDLTLLTTTTIGNITVYEIAATHGRPKVKPP